MIEIHEELLAAIESAETLAVKAYAGGAKIVPTIQKLRSAKAEVASRLSYYRANMPKKGRRAGKAAGAEQEESA